MTTHQFPRDEYSYCLDLVSMHGDDSVGHDPKTIATYLRLQASKAFCLEDFGVAARLGQAATCINEDARNNHSPDWARASEVLVSIEPAYLVGENTIERES